MNGVCGMEPAGWKLFVSRFQWVLMGLLISGCGGRATGPDSSASTPFDAARPPVLVVVQPTRNLGVVDLGKRVETFELSNSGGSDLTIKSITKSCSCLNAELSRDRIPPGQAATLELTIHPRQPEQRGASLQIATDDPLSPNFRVSVDWVARGPIQVDPEKFDFGVVRPGVPATISFVVVKDTSKVSADSQTHVQPTPRGAMTARLKAETSTTEQRSETWELTLEANDSGTDSTGSVQLTFDGADVGNIHIPVLWQLRNAVQATPKNLFLGVGGPGEVLTKSIEVTSDPGVALTIDEVTRIEGPIECITSVEEVNAETKRVEINATLPTSVGSYPARGMV